MTRFLVLLPNVVSAIAAATVDRSRRNACSPTPSQPPGYVFAVVWPILYLLLGVSMARTRRYPAALAALLVLMLALNMWWVRYGNVCEPMEAYVAIVKVLALAVVVTTYMCYYDVKSAMCLLPLVAWLCFATKLSKDTIIMNSHHR